MLDERFGLVVSDGRGSSSIRSETRDAPITSFMPQGRSWTSLAHPVAPDGRSIAYWSPVASGPVLRVRSVDGTDRAVFTGVQEMFGNAFTWSSDGGGIVVAIDNGCQESCAAQGLRMAAELWTIDVASGASERVASGSFWLPVTWDRGAKLVAAGTTGPGGYLTGYDVIDLSQRPAAVRSTPFRPAVLGQLRASSDGRFVLLFQDIPAAGELAWWPLAAPERRANIVFDGAAAEWRPGTSEIWWSGGLVPAGCRVPPCSGTQLVSFDVASGARRSLTGAFGGSLVGFRVDGAAAMTWLRAPDSLIAVDVTTGRTATLPTGGPFVRLR